jgi:hypothetical protein
MLIDTRIGAVGDRRVSGNGAEHREWLRHLSLARDRAATERPRARCDHSSGFGEGRHDIRPSQRRIDELDVLASGGVVDHAALRFGLELAASGSSSTSGGSLAGAADASVVIDNLIAEGDRVVAFWTLEGTHAGMLFRDAGHRAFLHPVTPSARFGSTTDGSPSTRWRPTCTRSGSNSDPNPRALSSAQCRRGGVARGVDPAPLPAHGLGQRPVQHDVDPLHGDAVQGTAVASPAP